MPWVAIFLLIVLIGWGIAKLAAQKKGPVKCNVCGHVGHLSPLYDDRDPRALTQQKLVCANCKSANWTPLKVVEAHQAEARRIESANRERIECRPHCQQCGNRVEYDHLFCTNCGSRDIVKHEDWLISPDKAQRLRLLMSREIAQFYALSQGKKYCEPCNGFLDESARFCPKCGAPAVDATRSFLFRRFSTKYPDEIKTEQDFEEIYSLAKGEQVSLAGRTCVRCGQTIQADSTLCSHCGYGYPEVELTDSIQSSSEHCPICGGAVFMDRAKMVCPMCGELEDDSE